MQRSLGNHWTSHRTDGGKYVQLNTVANRRFASQLIFEDGIILGSRAEEEEEEEEEEDKTMCLPAIVVLHEVTTGLGKEEVSLHIDRL